MKIYLSDLWCWTGTIDRGPYVFWGVLLFAIKFNIDRFVSKLLFDRPWSPFTYVFPGDVIRVDTVADRTYGLSMLAIALPFVWAGVVLTLRRLRAVRLPPGLIVCFFIPMLSLSFFLLMSVLPSRTDAPLRPENRAGMFKRILDAILPDHPWGSAALGLLITVVLGVATLELSMKLFLSYGFALFVFVPFCISLFSVLLYGYHRSRGFWECVGVGLSSIALLGLAIFVFAMEGIVCLLMAAPIAGVVGLVGGTIGYFIQRRQDANLDVPPILRAMCLAVPVFMGAERFARPESPVFAVRTAVEIQASPEQVWQRVIAFPELPAPNEWLFRGGIAYPTQATIHGAGVGATRHCIFSTGTVVEPITVWDEPRLLKFSVTSNPPPMREWSLYGQLHPPHLSGFMMSQAGQFHLEKLPNGHTRLEGTTWYQHHMWPARYWQLWADFIIHRIHLRVLDHIKKCAEDGDASVAKLDGFE